MVEAKPPTAEEAAARAAWINTPPIDRALRDVEEWGQGVLLDAGLPPDPMHRWWLRNRHRLGEPRKDVRWLAWMALNECYTARRVLAQGHAELALENACDAWRYAFWYEVSARRRHVRQNRENSVKAHGTPDDAARRAAYCEALERTDGAREKAKAIAAERCGCSARTISRALEKAK